MHPLIDNGQGQWSPKVVVLCALVCAWSVGACQSPDSEHRPRALTTGDRTGRVHAASPRAPTPGDYNDVSVMLGGYEFPGALPCCRYLDADYDGVVSASPVLRGCVRKSRFPNCGASEEGGGYFDPGEDCDDTDSSIHPGAEEDACDGGVDRDCDGLPHLPEDVPVWGVDEDGDGYSPEVGRMQTCVEPGAEAAIPGGKTGGPVQGGLGVEKFSDEAGDYILIESGDPADCDDRDPWVSPEGDENCNGVDDDCDGQLDEGLPSWTLYRDQDGDGFGDSGNRRDSCLLLSGYVILGGDCDDGDADASPGQTVYQELPRSDGTWDWNCDGVETKAEAENGLTYHPKDALDLIACSPGAFPEEVDCGDSDQLVLACDVTNTDRSDGWYQLETVETTQTCL